MRPHLLAPWLTLPIGLALGCSSSPSPSVSQPPTCIAPQVLCGTVCVDPTIDTMNCGACGAMCAAGKSCQAGLCACPSPTTDCNGQCVNSLGDPLNCGTCGQQCATGQSCASGTCVCQSGLAACATGCTDVKSDARNCGACGTICTAPQVCSQNACTSSCAAGETNCSGSCVPDMSTNVQHCGTCGNACPSGQSCQGGQCTCSGGLASCGGQCVDMTTSATHCGACGTACSAGQTCTAGACVGGTTPGTGGGTSTGGAGDGTSTGGAGGSTGGSTGSGGAGAGTATGGQSGSTATGGQGADTTTGGQGGGTSTGGGSPGGDGNCSPASMISNFEEGTATDPPIAINQEGRKGCWERFYETDTTNFTMAVEDSGDSSACNKYVLHVKGTSSAGWGDWVGVGVNLNETGTCGSNTTTNPQRYDASKYTGIQFRMKKGSGHDPKSAIRFNVSIPETEGPSTDQGDYLCDTATLDAVSDGGAELKAKRDCYQHMGRFFHVVSGYEPTTYNDTEVTSDWKTFKLCFDRDLYPLSLPGTLSNAQRDALSSKILKLQFQFNQGKDWYVSSYPSEGQYTDLEKTLPFEIYLDDVQFIEGTCPNSNVFEGDGFPANATVGTCAPATGAANVNNTISQAYDRWKKHFVQDNTVVAVEQEGVVTSESMGYGMLIAAMMGDQASFEAFSGYVQGKLSGGLMTWKDGDSGSATDGDMDIAYALLVADQKWGGYKTAADSMISAIKSGDVSGTKLKPGNGWDTAFNPSYFAPSYMKAFGGMDSVISGSYSLLKTNTGSNFPTDWTDWSGAAVMSPGQVTAQFTAQVYGYDAARVPWRIGLDGCANGGDGKTIVTTIVNFFAGKYDAGETIDMMKAGWIKSSGIPSTSSSGGQDARDMQGSFIGPLGVGAMASGNAAVRDRAMRTILDILENGDFNHTYFPSTVGFLSLLAMTGNFVVL